MTNDAPKPNVELLDRTLAEVRRAARRKSLRWDQRFWRRTDHCGTAMCFAGWAIELSGRQWAEPPGLGEAYGVMPEPGEPSEGSVQLDTGQTMRVRPVPTVAQKLLGVTSGEAYALFYEAVTLRDLSRTVREIKQRA